MYNVFRLLKNYVLNFLGSFLKKFKTPKFYIAVLLCLLFSCSMLLEARDLPNPTMARALSTPPSMYVARLVRPARANN